MKPTDIERLEREFRPITDEIGCELAHVEYDGRRLQVFLDHPDGVTLEHCQTASREISALLDVIDWGPGRYVLEVSSPGLDRKLHKPADYERFEGETVRVTWRDPEDRRKQTVVGLMSRFERSAGGAIHLEEVEGKKEHNIALKDIESARLEPQF